MGLRLKDVNICILCILCLTPFVLETLVFSTGLISLSSSPENRLFQNSLIFGIHLIIELIVLAPLTYRTELTKKLFPRYKIKYTFADNIFPWLAILGALFTFATIVENYLRNGKGYDVTFFFYSSDIAGYILYSAKCGIMIALTALTYKEEYDYALPSLRKKR
ncbi:hypothetical protein CKO50_10220 [Pseudoalteromonas sp. HM-SA03]|nr:hypothetical protein CKO50_10220 [Pseudoalteromonas sp. HM-SA03]